MKYLVHLRPSEEFSKLALQYKHNILKNITQLLDNILHCTLYLIYVNPSNEEKIIHILDGITDKNFDIKTGSMSLFDKNSLVVRLEKSNEILGLHQNIIKSLKEYVKWDETPIFPEYENRNEVYNKYGSPYCGRYYNPHIAIAKVNPDFIKESSFFRGLLKGIEWKANEFYLSKKEQEWKTIKKFSLK